MHTLILINQIQTNHSATWQPGWEESGGNGYTYIYMAESLSCLPENYHSIFNQLYANTKQEKFFKKLITWKKENQTRVSKRLENKFHEIYTNDLSLQKIFFS